MRKKRRRRKNNYGLLAVAFCLVMLVTGFVGKQFISEVRATNEIQSPYYLSEISLNTKEKAAPTKYNGKERKIVYLTFDDGPSEYTDKLIDILEEENVPATFYLLGANVKAYPEQVKKLDEKGHYVGLHSMTHDYNTLYKNKKFVKEMVQVQSLIHDLTGETPIMARAPYGSVPGIDQAIVKEIKQANLKIWDWTIDSSDWRLQKTPKKIVDTIESQLTEDVEVVLMHDKEGTIKALPGIIKMLREKGYEFEVYSEDAHFPVNFLKDDNL